MASNNDFLLKVVTDIETELLKLFNDINIKEQIEVVLRECGKTGLNSETKDILEYIESLSLSAKGNEIFPGYESSTDPAVESPTIAEGAREENPTAEASPTAVAAAAAASPAAVASPAAAAENEAEYPLYGYESEEALRRARKAYAEMVKDSKMLGELKDLAADGDKLAKETLAAAAEEPAADPAAAAPAPEAVAAVASSTAAAAPDAEAPDAGPAAEEPAPAAEEPAAEETAAEETAAEEPAASPAAEKIEELKRQINEKKEQLDRGMGPFWAKLIEEELKELNEQMRKLNGENEGGGKKKRTYKKKKRTPMKKKRRSQKKRKKTPMKKKIK